MNKRNYQKELDRLIENITKEGRVPRLFLHSCCAPCSSYVLEYLSQYFEITVFFYNPNICFVYFSNNVRSLKQAKNIAYQNTDQTFQHFTQLFSPRSRIINFREVPRNPNASRTLFSIYLVYEKCISSLSFTKITNVGGLTPTCVI